MPLSPYWKFWFVKNEKWQVQAWTGYWRKVFRFLLLFKKRRTTSGQVLKKRWKTKISTFNKQRRCWKNVGKQKLQFLLCSEKWITARKEGYWIQVEQWKFLNFEKQRTVCGVWKNVGKWKFRFLPCFDKPRTSEGDYWKKIRDIITKLTNENSDFWETNIGVVLERKRKLRSGAIFWKE